MLNAQVLFVRNTAPMVQVAYSSRRKPTPLVKRTVVNESVSGGLAAMNSMTAPRWPASSIGRPLLAIVSRKWDTLSIAHVGTCNPALHAEDEARLQTCPAPRKWKMNRVHEVDGRNSKFREGAYVECERAYVD